MLKDKKYAIQLLFFSQDDLITNQLYKGLIASKGVENVKFGRLYDYHETDDSEIKALVCRNSDNIINNNIYISLEDNIR